MIRKIVSVLLNKWLLVFTTGILFSSAFHFKTESIYEDAIFAAIVDKIKTEANSGCIDSFFIHAMQMTHTLEKNRSTTFNGRTLIGIKANLFRPATIDLMTGNGACGSYSTVLARILKSAGFKVRIAQMSVNGTSAGHMVVEAKKRSDWIVLDPMMQQYFKKPNGVLASFNDVHQNWDYYKAQTHGNYTPTFNYENVRYTNWEKYPTLGKFIKSTIAIFAGEKAAEEFSIRSFLLRKYNLLFLATVGLLIVSTSLMAFSFYRSNK